MKNTQILLMAGACVFSAITLPAAGKAADPRPLVINEISGDARIHQNLPCGNAIDVSTPIVGGYMRMTWVPTARSGEVLIDLTQLTMTLSPFQVEATCKGVGGFADFREIGAQLASAVRFTAQQTSESGVFRFSIPKEQFLIYESVIDNLPVPQPEGKYKKPAEDVTGVIDVRRQTMQLSVGLTSKMHFRAGCQRDRCVIDETLTGTIATEMRGRNVPPPRRAAAGTPGMRGTR